MPALDLLILGLAELWYPTKTGNGLLSKIKQAGEDLTRTRQIFPICMRNKSTNISGGFNVFRTKSFHELGHHAIFGFFYLLEQ